MPSRVQKNSTSTIKRKKRKNKKARVILFVLLLIILIAGGCFLFTSSYFNLTQLEVTGYDEYTSEIFLEKYGVSYGTNVFLDYMKFKKNKIEELSYVEKTKVSIALPNKIIIEVTSKSSEYIAYDKDSQKYYFLDANGYILKEVTMQERQDEILIQGVTFDDEVKIGTKINDIDYNKIVTFCKIKSEYEKVINTGKITKVNFESSLTTVTINDKLNVVFPNDKELTYNMKFLKGILEKLEEDPKGTIDMTKSNPSFSSY